MRSADKLAHEDAACLLAAVEAVRQECHAFEWDLEDTAHSAAQHILNVLETALKGGDAPEPIASTEEHVRGPAPKELF